MPNRQTCLHSLTGIMKEPDENSTGLPTFSVLKSDQFVIIQSDPDQTVEVETQDEPTTGLCAEQEQGSTEVPALKRSTRLRQKWDFKI